MIPVGSVVEMRFPSDVRFLSLLLASCRDLNVLYGFSAGDGQRIELASTAVEAEEAEKLGYVFCGVLPGTPGGDELLYLHRQGVAPFLETLRPRGALGRLLRESIRKACSF